MSRLDPAFWAATPMPPVPLLKELREVVLDRSHTRLAKWRFRMASDFVLQIQPKPAERRDKFRLFECSAIEGADIKLADFHSRQGRSGKRRLLFGITELGDGWAFNPRRISWPTADLEKAWAFRARVIGSMEGSGFVSLTRSMMLSPACLCCGKGLTDPASMARWIGPECAQTNSLAVTRLWQGGDKLMDAQLRRRGKSASTLVMEYAVHEIVRERAPITVRGVAYALFVRGLTSSMATNETQKVSRIMTAMRERGDLDWTLIVDGSRSVDRASWWSNPDQIIRAAVKGYRRDYWQDQPARVEVWSEKSTVHGVLQPVLEEFGVTFRVIKGFGSFTSLRQAAADSQDFPPDCDAVALYIGDRDPSGLFMSEVDIPTRLARYGSRWRFLRIAVLPEDARLLPSFGAKTTDPRFQWHVQRYGTRCWELDAMDPNELRTRVREQIETRLNLPLWEHAKEIEAAEVSRCRRSMRRGAI